MSSTTNTLRPTPFQARVLSVPEDHFIFLGGGRGGGKSFGLQLLILRHCDQYKHRARVLVTRRRLKSLLQFAEEMRGLFRSAYGQGFSFNQNDSVFRLANGATVALTHCESSSALQDTVQGMTFSLIVVDEAGEGPELPVIDALALTLRAGRSASHDPRREPGRREPFRPRGSVRHSTRALGSVRVRRPEVGLCAFDRGR